LEANEVEIGRTIQEWHQLLTQFSPLSKKLGTRFKAKGAREVWVLCFFAWSAHFAHNPRRQSSTIALDHGTDTWHIELPQRPCNCFHQRFLHNVTSRWELACWTTTTSVTVTSFLRVLLTFELANVVQGLPKKDVILKQYDRLGLPRVSQIGEGVSPHRESPQ